MTCSGSEIVCKIWTVNFSLFNYEQNITRLHCESVSVKSEWIYLGLSQQLGWDQWYLVWVCVCVCILQVCGIHLHEGDAERIVAVPQQRLTLRERLVIERNSIDLLWRHNKNFEIPHSSRATGLMQHFAFKTPKIHQFLRTFWRNCILTIFIMHIDFNHQGHPNYPSAILWKYMVSISVHWF